MPPRTGLHTNRLRANSFGGAAREYDAHRPMYPDQMIDDLLATGGQRVLDVGTGTGHAAQQFSSRGATVLGVEPDERMATVAREKGLPVELGTFEKWEPAGRTFDLVVFAASFHWVDPEVALPKVRELLNPGGRLALLWNRFVPTNPSREEFNAIYRDYMDIGERSVDDESETVLEPLESARFAVDRRTYPHDHTTPREQWLDTAFTYSNLITLTAEKAAELRQRLSDLIGPQGVQVGGQALALIATPG